MGHYFENDSSVKSEIIKRTYSVASKNFYFFTDNGVFSKTKLDFGSRLLIETLVDLNLGNNCLDVGCGYGPIGICLAKIKNIHFDMIDINKRAIHLCKKNIIENDALCTAFLSDVYENVCNKYDTIVTNPPIRAGKKKIYEIVINASEYLNDNGTLYIVIRKDQGAKSMISDLENIYNVSVLKKSKGFFIIGCKKSLTC